MKKKLTVRICVFIPILENRRPVSRRFFLSSFGVYSKVTFCVPVSWNPFYENLHDSELADAIFIRERETLWAVHLVPIIENQLPFLETTFKFHCKIWRYTRILFFEMLKHAFVFLLDEILISFSTSCKTSTLGVFIVNVCELLVFLKVIVEQNVIRVIS